MVVHDKIADGNPWIWRARFFGHEPQTDKALLERGFHVVYVDVSGLWGSPEAVARWDTGYKYFTEVYGFDKKTVLEGMSRGGLIIFNWAAKNPKQVHCIYADAPLCTHEGEPIVDLQLLADADVALLHVVGDSDKMVPVAQHTAIVERQYRALGGEIQVIHKKNIGHHPHSLKDPKPIVEFVMKHAQHAIGDDSGKTADEIQ